MIIVEKGFTQSLFMTLCENSRLVDPFYHIEFISNEDNYDNILYVLKPVNSNERYDEIEIFIDETTFESNSYDYIVRESQNGLTASSYYIELGSLEFKYGNGNGTQSSNNNISDYYDNL